MTVLPQTGSSSSCSTPKGGSPLSPSARARSWSFAECPRGQIPCDWRLVSAHTSGAVLLWQPLTHGGMVLVQRMMPDVGPCRCALLLRPFAQMGEHKCLPPHAR